MKKKCEICGSIQKLQFHHQFSQSKLNQNLYPDHIHSKKNCQILCSDCHLSKRTGIIIWNEQAFCENLNIIPRSKTGLEIYKRRFYK